MPSDTSATVRRALRSGVPASTYRLQLRREFDFEAARAVLPYLSALGITHCYLSPIFSAVPGSTHGYDVCRHTDISQELGGEAGFNAFVDELARHGMGLVLDFVPNHMSNDPGTNEWWRDVLENGPSSPYAKYFDIDWNPVKAELKDRLLLPILGEPYGEALERGALQLRIESGALVLAYGDFRLPINPRRIPLVFEHGLHELEEALGADSPDLLEFLSILTAQRNLPVYTARDALRIAERQREKEVARGRLVRLADTCPAVRAHIGRAVEVFNGTPGDARSFDRLHDLLEMQAYRLASWRTASDEINYRRFFDINALAGLRVEDPEVFDAIHGLLLRLVGSGRATGVRLDHIDGLHDPTGYLSRLRTALAVASQTMQPPDGAAAPANAARAPAYVVVEKIEARDERLRQDWAVAGTTGYTFLGEVNRLLVDARHARKLQRLYSRLSGRMAPFADVAYDSKRLIVSTALSSEFQMLAQAVNRFSENDRRFRDFTLGSIRRALRELVACFPVYRTYVRRSGATDTDLQVLDQAIEDARRRNPAMEWSIFDFLRFVLAPREGDTEDEVGAQARSDIAMRFQQYTAPVHAKGVEDTAFYRHHVLVSLNEVGNDPAAFGISTTEWHTAMRERRQRHPQEMLATTTHDTKRSEDARARIAVISEIPDAWQSAVMTWRRLNATNRTQVTGNYAPDPNDEYLFYQSLVGAWPCENLELDGPVAAPADLVARMSAYMQKAIKEAKLHTSWITPNAEYESAVERFVQRTLTGQSAGAFLTAFVAFVRRIARAGATNALSQLLLKLCAPGVPDFYQGTELWDLSLVDPDNRRAVDWPLRQRAFASVEALLDEGDVLPEPARIATAVPGPRRRAVADLLASWPDGRLKLLVTALVLRWRRAHPAVFAEGDYVPLAVSGTRAEHVVAFARRAGPDTLLVAVPRLTMGLSTAGGWATGEASWGDTTIRLPGTLAGRPIRALLDSRQWDAVPPDGTSVDLPVREVFQTLPIAILWSHGSTAPAHDAAPSG